MGKSVQETLRVQLTSCAEADFRCHTTFSGDKLQVKRRPRTVNQEAAMNYKNNETGGAIQKNIVKENKKSEDS